MEFGSQFKNQYTKEDIQVCLRPTPRTNKLLLRQHVADLNAKYNIIPCKWFQEHEHSLFIDGVQVLTERKYRIFACDYMYHINAINRKGVIQPDHKSGSNYVEHFYNTSDRLVLTDLKENFARKTRLKMSLKSPTSALIDLNFNNIRDAKVNVGSPRIMMDTGRLCLRTLSANQCPWPTPRRLVAFTLPKL